MAVTGIGMVSALGLDARTSCAAARAGINRAATLDAFQVYDEDEWTHVGATGHALREFTGGFEGFGKLVRLATGALTDLLDGTPIRGDEWSRTALCVGVSSAYFERESARLPGASAEGAERLSARMELVRGNLLERCCRLCSMPSSAQNRFLVVEDQSGFVRTLLMAQSLLSNGRFDRCVLGGVDACTEGSAMAAAHHFHVLKTGDQAAGYQPGEAAAFVLLERASSPGAGGGDVLAVIESAALAREVVGRVDDRPALGIGLAAAIDSCLGHLPASAAAPGWLIGDLNGDAFRANDWGYALVRLQHLRPGLADCPLTLPAESFGEIGAATGPVAVCMAVRAFARRYAPAEHALVWLADYSGPRAAFGIRAAR